MGLCGNGSVIGPIFFERNLNGAAYQQMLNEEVFPKLLETIEDQRLFFAGPFKNKVYVMPPTDIDDLTQRITENAELLKRDLNLVRRQFVTW